MPINAHPDYLAAEKAYLSAQTLEDRIEKLKKMISLAPSHKGAENLRAQLKTRLKKFQSQLEKSKKSGKSKRTSIKKEDMQVVIIGKTNTGKSSILSQLTNAEPEIANYEFTTKNPVLGIMKHEGVNVQIIENPSLGSEYYDKGLTNNADVILMVLNSIEDIGYIEKNLQKAEGKKIIVFNKSDTLSKEEERKLSETLKSKFKKYKFVLISYKNKKGFEELKQKIFLFFDKIRIYTKEPKKEKSPRPVIMDKNSSVKDVAEKILKGLSSNVKEIKIWGPSSKFSGQKVGLSHRLKDRDIVELKTK